MRKFDFNVNNNNNNNNNNINNNNNNVSTPKYVVHQQLQSTKSIIKTPKTAYLKEVEQWLRYYRSNEILPIPKSINSNINNNNKSKSNKKNLKRMTSQSELAIPNNSDAPFQSHETSGYYILIRKINGVRIPESIRSKYPLSSMSYRVNLTLFHEGSKQVFGRTHKSDSFALKAGVDNFSTIVVGEQGVYLKSNIVDETCHLIVELILELRQTGWPTKRIGVGWTILPLFKLSSENYAQSLSASFYAGSPRSLFFVDTNIQWKKNLISLTSCQIIYEIHKCQQLQTFFHLFRDNEFIGIKDKIGGINTPGNVLPSSPNAPIWLQCQNNMPTFSMSIDHPLIHVSKDFESILLANLTVMRRNYWPKKRQASVKKRGLGARLGKALNLIASIDASQEIDGLIKSRQLLIGLHNGRKFIREPVTCIHLEAKEASNTHLSLSFEGMQHIRDVLCSINGDPLMALIFELQYIIEWTGKEPSTNTISVGWSIHPFASTTLRFDGTRQRIDFMRNKTRTLMNNVLYTGFDQYVGTEQKKEQSNINEHMLILEIGLMSPQLANVEIPRSPIHTPLPGRLQHQLSANAFRTPTYNMSEPLTAPYRLSAHDSSLMPPSLTPPLTPTPISQNIINASYQSPVLITPATNTNSNIQHLPLPPSSSTPPPSQNIMINNNVSSATPKPIIVQQMSPVGTPTNVYQQSTPIIVQQSTPPATPIIIQQATPPQSPIYLQNLPPSSSQQQQLQQPQQLYISPPGTPIRTQSPQDFIRSPTPPPPPQAIFERPSRNKSPIKAVRTTTIAGAQQIHSTSGFDLSLEVDDPNRHIDFNISFVSIQHPAHPRSIIFTFSFFHLPFYVSPPIALVYYNNEIATITTHSYHVSIPPNEYIDFAVYLHQKDLCIDVWDAESLMHLGTSCFPLINCLRQGRLRNEQTYTINLEKNLEYGGVFVASPVQLKTGAIRSPVDPGIVIDVNPEYWTLNREHLGQLQMSIVHTARTVEADWQQTINNDMKKMIPTFLSGNHLLLAKLFDRPLHINLKVASGQARKVLSKPLREFENNNNNNNNNNKNNRIRINVKSDKIGRMPIKLHRSDINQSFLDRDLEIRRLEEARELRKRERLLKMVQQHLVTSRTITPSLGEAVYFEVKFTNPYPRKSQFYITIFDPTMNTTMNEASIRFQHLEMRNDQYPNIEPEMSLVTDLEEYKHWCSINGNHIPDKLPYVDDHGINIKSTQKLIEVGANQEILLPFKFQSFNAITTICNGHGQGVMNEKLTKLLSFPHLSLDYDENNDENTLPSLTLKSRTISITIQGTQRKHDIAKVEVNISPKPTIIDRTYRFHHWSGNLCRMKIPIKNPISRVAQQFFKIPNKNNNKQSQIFQANLDILKATQPLSFYCTDNRVTLEFKHDSLQTHQMYSGNRITNINHSMQHGIQPGDEPILYLTCDTPQFPKVLPFHILMYSDPYRSTLCRVIEIYIHSHINASLDSAVALGDIANGQLIMPPSTGLANVQLYSSRSRDFSFGIRGRFDEPSPVFELNPQQVSQVHFQYRSSSVGRKMSMLHLVDVDRSCLVNSWLLLADTRLPKVDTSYEKTIRINDSRRFRASFTNIYERTKTFTIRSTNDELVYVETPSVTIPAQHDINLVFTIKSTSYPDSKDVFAFVEDEMGRHEHCFKFKLDFVLE